MIIQNILNAVRSEPAVPAIAVPSQQPDFGWGYSKRTVSGKSVTVETSKSIATAYRCGNILSDDIASMPLQ